MSFESAVDLEKDLQLDCDVCVVGSGAGGAVLAAGLAEAGLDVVVLEAGPYRTRADFTMHEKDTYPVLYQEGMKRATKDLAISVLQGRNVGGGTTVNWTSCFRTPERILAHWREHFALEDLTSEALRPHFEAVEARLSIAEWPLGATNPNNRALVDGCTSLGWEVGPMRRNQKGCANSGYCGMGCPVDGKQAMHVTTLKDASAAGARILAEAHVDELEGWPKVRAVHARAWPVGTAEPTSRRITVRPKVVALCGGAINSPAVLLRSGIHVEGRVGHRTFLHPVVAVIGTYARPIDPWYGAPQSAHSHEFIDRGADKVGFFLEAAPLHPLLAAVSFKLFGAAHAALMRQLRHASALLALSVDGLVPGDDGGTVILGSSGRAELRYPIRGPLIESFRASHEALCRVHLAAGARSLTTTHVDPVVLTTEADLPAVAAAPYGALEHGIFSAHQMGGCTMTGDGSGVVDPRHRVEGSDNLFVVDGSVLPTSLGVNPSETIYGLAHRARAFVKEAV